MFEIVSVHLVHHYKINMFTVKSSEITNKQDKKIILSSNIAILLYIKFFLCICTNMNI